MGIEGIGCVGMGWDECEGAWVSERVQKLIWKVQGEYGKSEMVIEALSSFQARHIHLKPSKPISGYPHSSEVIHIHSRPSTSIQGHPYPTKPSISISSPPHPPKALYTHPKPFTPISGPPQPPKAFNTHLRPFTPT